MFGIRWKFRTLSFGDFVDCSNQFFHRQGSTHVASPVIFVQLPKKSRQRRQKKRSLKPSHVERAQANRGHIGNCLVKSSSSYSTTIADESLWNINLFFHYHFSSSSCVCPTIFTINILLEERSIFHDISHSPCNCSRSLSHTIARHCRERAERNMPKKGNNERNRPLAHRHEPQPSSSSLSTKLANCSDVYSLSLE